MLRTSTGGGRGGGGHHVDREEGRQRWGVVEVRRGLVLKQRGWQPFVRGRRGKASLRVLGQRWGAHALGSSMKEDAELHLALGAAVPRGAAASTANRFATGVDEVVSGQAAKAGTRGSKGLEHFENLAGRRRRRARSLDITLRPLQHIEVGRERHVQGGHSWRDKTSRRSPRTRQGEKRSRRYTQKICRDRP